MRIEPDPSPEEVRAIMVALAVALEDREGPEEDAVLYRSRWRLAGIEPDPSPEEVRAIMDALAVVLEVREGPEEAAMPYRSRWRLAGLLGRSVPRGMKLEGSLWSYSGWEGMV